MRSHARSRGILVVGALLSLGMAPALALADGYVTVGSQYWSQSEPEATYQAFTEVPRGAFVESFLYRDDIAGGHTGVWGSNVIRSDQAYTLVYSRPRWTVDVDYQQTPHNLSFVSRTGYTLVDPATQLLPDSLQLKNQTNPAQYAATMTDFLNTAHSENLAFRTDVTTARLKARPKRGLQVELDGSRRNRSGDKAYGGSFGFNNVIETIEPVRQQMASADGRVSYTKKKVTVEGDAGYTAFENDNNVLIWDNPQRLTDAVGAPGKGMLDLYPDNQSWHVMGQVGVQLPRRTAFTGTYSFGQSTQNDKWLPMTVNSAVLAPDTFPLPSSQSYAKANISTLDARLTSHPMEKVGGTARFHFNKYDNKTPEWTFAGQVPYDGAWTAGAVTSDPVGNEQMVAGLDVDFNPIKQGALYGTVERIDRKHTFREVPEDHETAFEGKVRVKPRTGLQADARYRHGERKADEFDDADYRNAAGALIEQPDLRRYDVADRTQDLVEGSISWSGVEKVTVALTGNYLRNDYTKSALGLQDDLRRSVDLQVTADPADQISLNGSFGWARIDSNQRSRQSSGATLVASDSTNWTALLRDEIVSAAGEIQYQAIPDKVTLNLNYWYERSPGTFDLAGFEALSTVPDAQDLPATLYMRQGVGFDVKYAFQDGLDLVARWAWEELNAVDFANQNLPLLSPATGPANAIYLGDETLNYHANAVAIVVNRTF